VLAKSRADESAIIVLFSYHLHNISLLIFSNSIARPSASTNVMCNCYQHTIYGADG
jgi:hypothetical protein